jgi:hypothetical protein
MENILSTSELGWILALIALSPFVGNCKFLFRINYRNFYIGEFGWCSKLALLQKRNIVEQELLTLPEHLSSPPVFSGVIVTRSLVLCVYDVDRCLSFCTFSFSDCDVSSSIYGFWLTLWYRQAPLNSVKFICITYLGLRTYPHYCECHCFITLTDYVSSCILLYYFCAW